MNVPILLGWIALFLNLCGIAINVYGWLMRSIASRAEDRDRADRAEYIDYLERRLKAPRDAGHRMFFGSNSTPRDERPS